MSSITTVAATAAAAKAQPCLTPSGLPDNFKMVSRGRVAFPVDLAQEHLNDPRLYGMQLDGQCLEPRILHGSMLILSPAAPLVRGEAVALHFRDGRQSQVKFLVALPPPALLRAMAHPKSEATGAILMEMLNPGRLIAFPLAELSAAHAVVGVIPPGEFTVRRLEPAAKAPRRKVTS